MCILSAGLVVGMLATPQALAQKKKIDVSMIASGSVDDEKLLKDAPKAIISAKGLEKVWKAWGIKDDMPKVDFDKLIVVGTYSSGSRLKVSGAFLDDKGNLEVLGFGTADLRPGFRFVLGTVPKEGVKTVGKQELPKE
jgi:hypothetical protein